jgi:soluble lytic murein transglycosylase-like protein
MQERKKKLLAAILLIESKGNAMASSCENAKGAWQVRYGWKKKLHITGSLFDPSINLNAAVRVFDIHLSDAKGNERRALKAYSGGSHWYPKKVMLLASSI